MKEHPENKLSTIEIKEDGIIIFDKDGHSAKAFSSIEVTEDGSISFITFNDEYLLKVYFLIDLALLEIMICDNDKHPSKACSPIEVTNEGMVFQI